MLTWSNVESEVTDIPLHDTIINFMARRDSSISAMSVFADMTIPVVVYRSAAAAMPR